MELQLPLVRRILQRHSNVEYHIWNLARESDDGEWLKTIDGEHITVINDFYGCDPWKRFSDVYEYYSGAEYSDCLFVKMDDDIVFLQTERFGDFIKAVDQNRLSVVSAKVINNGACVPTELGLWREFTARNEPLLDVHKSVGFAWLSHRYMFANSKSLLAQSIKLIPTADWLSINMIGYDWKMGRRIVAELKQLCEPRYVAGRELTGQVGDEGAVNMLPRLICQGFLACHLSFGPQGISDEHLDALRKRYASIGQDYLDELDDSFLTKTIAV